MPQAYVTLVIIKNLVVSVQYVDNTDFCNISPLPDFVIMILKSFDYNVLIVINFGHSAGVEPRAFPTTHTDHIGF